MEQGLSPEFLRWYKQSPEVRAGDIYLGRDLAEEDKGLFWEHLNMILPLLTMGGTIVLVKEVLKGLKGFSEIERAKEEDIYQKRY